MLHTFTNLPVHVSLAPVEGESREGNYLFYIQSVLILRPLRPWGLLKSAYDTARLLGTVVAG